jgi:hypothetical protein
LSATVDFGLLGRFAAMNQFVSLFLDIWGYCWFSNYVLFVNLLYFTKVCCPVASLNFVFVMYAMSNQDVAFEFQLYFVVL